MVVSAIGSLFMRRFWQGLSITRRGAFILVLPTFLTLSTLSSWAWSRQQERIASEGVTHTENILKESSELLTLLVDAETGVRGYGLTKDTAFLEPYEEARRSIPARFEQLDRLVPSGSSQQMRLEEIDNKIDNYLVVLEETYLFLGSLNGERADDSSELQALIEAGKADLDVLRQDLDTLRAEERDLLSLRRQALTSTKRFVDRLLAITALLSLLSYAVAFYLYRHADREIMSRNRELEIANESLSQFNIALAKRNQDLDEFTHTVSHDLKAPLRAIDNLSTWIAEDLDIAAESDVGKQITLLQARVAKMRSLIEGLLQYSRTGREVVRYEQVDVAQLVQDVVEGLALSPDFRVHVDPSLPTIATQRLPLQQVLSNLIDNSYKYHDRVDGKVAISAQRIQENCYEFVVADDGPGIAPEYQERVFKIFQTLANSHSDSTGIGLSLVKKIVESRGGQIRLDSDIGQGATFYFTWLI